MDPSKYRTLRVARGFTYNTYHAPAAPGQPTLLLLHGFPSTAYEWRKQAPFFEQQGVGVLAPDLLGAGASAHPADVAAFRLGAMAGDVVEILDALGLGRVVGAGHDWGSILLARLALLHADRFAGFVWLGLGFLPAIFPADANAPKAPAQAQGPAYWEFFMREDAAEVIAQNPDSFLQLMYPADPAVWTTWLVQPGKTAECVENGVLLGRPGWLSDEEYEKLKQDLLTHGVASTLLWYTCEFTGGNHADNAQLPKEPHKISAPSLFVGASKDVVALEAFSLQLMQAHATALQTASLPAGHWLQIEAGDELNRVLEGWLATL